MSGRCTVLRRFTHYCELSGPGREPGEVETVFSIAGALVLYRVITTRDRSMQCAFFTGRFRVHPKKTVLWACNDGVSCGIEDLIAGVFLSLCSGLRMPAEVRSAGLVD